MPTITEQVEELNGAEVAREELSTPDKGKPHEPEEAWPIPVVEPQLGEQDLPKEEDGLPKNPSRLSPANGPRTPLQPAKASGVIYNVSEPILTPPPTPPKSSLKTGPPKGIKGSTVNKVNKSPLQDATRLEQSPGEHAGDTAHSPVSPSKLRCSHSDRAGQELCYLCHQRSERNAPIPITFAEERRQRELEEDRLLQQYQRQKDTEAIHKEQSKNFNNRCYNQKVAAFNLGVSEAVKEKLGTRPTEFCRSYLFQNRPLTPPRYLKQDEYSKELGSQVLTKHDKLSKLRKEQEFLERLEQVQLAEDLALQREQYLRDKKMGSDAYRKALDAQVRFKPLPIPALEPDSKAPIFGVLDATEEKLIDRKRRANQLYQEQLEMVAQKKRDAILKDLKNQREESDMLERTRREYVLKTTPS